MPRDYMDDLEGFFYVLCHIIFVFSKPGVRNREPPRLFLLWAEEDNSVVAAAKSCMLGGDFPVDDIPSFWGAAIRTMMLEFRTVLSEIFDTKTRITRNRSLDRDGKLEALSAFAQDVDTHFDKVKAIFDSAISQLELEGLCPEELKCRSNPPAPTTRRLAPAPTSGVTGRTPHAIDPMPKVHDEGDGQLKPLDRTTASGNATASKTDAAPPIAEPIVACAPPAITLPVPDPVNVEPRRSARIRNLHLAQDQQPLAAPEVYTGPRRSSRLLKRRLEEDEQPEARPSKARRTARRPPRATKRSS